MMMKQVAAMRHLDRLKNQGRSGRLCQVRDRRLDEGLTYTTRSFEKIAEQVRESSIPWHPRASPPGQGREPVWGRDGDLRRWGGDKLQGCYAMRLLDAGEPEKEGR
jgi:hypothetical protein